MSEEQELAQSYRFRAEELRAIADLDRETTNREILMNVARDYDRRARNLEVIDRTNKGVRVT